MVVVVGVWAGGGGRWWGASDGDLANLLLELNNYQVPTKLKFLPSVCALARGAKTVHDMAAAQWCRHALVVHGGFPQASPPPGPQNPTNFAAAHRAYARRPTSPRAP